VLSSGGRVLCAVGLGASVGEAQTQAYALIEPIHFRGMQWRRDIGYRAVARERSRDRDRDRDRERERGRSRGE
jgi:phosphoribosylamine--glycine ligase